MTTPTCKHPSVQKLLNHLDGEFSRVVEDTKKLFPELDVIERSGTISGFLLTTGVHVAAKNGAPRDVLETALLKMVEDAYRKLAG